MSSSPSLLESDRRGLYGHRLRGLPAFWLGFLAVAFSLLGTLARQREIPEIRTFARNFLNLLPGKDGLFAGIFHFQASPPFATIVTWVGVALLIWGWVELLGASRIKRELAEAVELKRRQQLVEEMATEGSPNAKSGPA